MRTRAAERLGDLQAWAEVIFESLHHPTAMESVLGKPALRDVRELSWILRDKLYILRTQLELAPAVQEPWARSRNATIDGLPTGA